jgi:hypothetical protein
MAWLCDVIDTDFIEALHANTRCAIPSQPTRFVTRVDLDIFDGIAWFTEINVALRPKISYFKKISRDPLLQI